MNRVNQREIIDCGFYLLMVYSMLKLVIEFVISLFNLLQTIIELFIEYKDILFTPLAEK